MHLNHCEFLLKYKFWDKFGSENLTNSQKMLMLGSNIEYPASIAPQILLYRFRKPMAWTNKMPPYLNLFYLNIFYFENGKTTLDFPYLSNFCLVSAFPFNTLWKTHLSLLLHHQLPFIHQLTRSGFNLGLSLAKTF